MSLASFLKLVLLTAFCFLLVIIRVHISNTASYVFLPYNLLLAWIPLLFAWIAGRTSNKLLLSLALFGWLIFFPNAPYIITDMLHLKKRIHMPLWFDCVLLYSFAFSGFTLGMLSAVMVYTKLKELFVKWVARLLMLGSMLVAGYAIYLGRFLRWNSWDMVLNPMDILSDTATRLIHPFSHQQAYGVTLSTGVLLCIVFMLYESFIVKEPA